MKNGYYLSVYCCVDEVGFALRAQMRHDQNIALWELNNDEIQLIHYWELERITGEKQHNRPFVNKEHLIFFINSLLLKYNLCLNDMEAIFGTDCIETSDDYKSIPHKNKLPTHSFCHAFSSLIDTKLLFEHTHIILAVDGGPDNLFDNGFDLLQHYVAIIFNQGRIEGIEPISSPACLWTEASCDFNLKEGTLMALAEACPCRLQGESFNMDSFRSMWEMPKLRREFDRIFSCAKNEANNYDNRFSEDDNIYSSVMKIVQKKSMVMLEETIIFILNKYNIQPERAILTIVGGYALNCPTNSYIMKKFHFMSFIAPPCVNDSGIALGIGLLAFYTDIGNKIKFQLGHAFYGDDDGFSDTTNDLFGKYIKSIEKFDANTFVNDINNAPVCWFEGRAEIGPRALGHRSILSVATSYDSKNKLNVIKQRQWWRPVAPIILEDQLENWFKDAYSSPFMLNTFEVNPNKKDLIPAVIHLNNSSRIQTIDINHSLYFVLNSYFEITGIPVICNTSLNDRGEPIINKLSELFNFALRKNIPVIYIEKMRYVLNLDVEYPEIKPYERICAFTQFEKQYCKSIMDKYIGVVINDEVLDYYVNHNKNFDNIDLLNPNDIDIIASEMRMRQHENISS